jgi:hypothetical protein
MASTVESEIRELEERVRQADVVTDPDFFDEVLVDGFTLTAQNGAIYTKEQVLAAHRPAGTRKFERFDTSDLRIHALENAAIVIVRADMAMPSMQLALLYTRFWLKLDGRWRIAAATAVELEHSH